MSDNTSPRRPGARSRAASCPANTINSKPSVTVKRPRSPVPSSDNVPAKKQVFGNSTKLYVVKGDDGIDEKANNSTDRVDDKATSITASAASLPGTTITINDLTPLKEFRAYHPGKEVERMRVVVKIFTNSIPSNIRKTKTRKMLVYLGDESLVTLWVERDTDLYWQAGDAVWKNNQIVDLQGVLPAYRACKLELRYDKNSRIRRFEAGKTPSWASIQTMVALKERDDDPCPTGA